MWMTSNVTRCRLGNDAYFFFLTLLCSYRILVTGDSTGLISYLGRNDSEIHEIGQSEVTLTVQTTTIIANLTSDNEIDSSSATNNNDHSKLPLVPLHLFPDGTITCLPYQGIYVNHNYFQIANAFFLLSHLAPSTLHGVLYLRCTLLVGCVFLTLWGWTIVCWMDAALWNILFIVIDFVHICTLIYRLRPIRFSKEIEEVYHVVFEPLHVSRQQFKKILSCMKAIRQLKYQELYAQERVTKVDSLSLVLSGKLVISQNGKALHIVFPHQFLDSPEWFTVSTDEFFQVSITAMEESRILLWHRDKLKLSIISDQFLQVVFDHILGRDVVKKLMQVSETMAATTYQQQNGQIFNQGSISSQDADIETKMFVVKKNGENKITALITRQFQEERIPLLYSNPDMLSNALHRIERLNMPNVPMFPVCNNARSSF